MARLTIRLLGLFQVRLNGSPIKKFESNKVRALLAYLAVESDHAHSREKLADLFWPELTANRARSNLSQALYNLQVCLNNHQAQPPYLIRSLKTVQFNPDSDYWLDVQAFSADLADGNLRKGPLYETWANYCQRQQAAVELYRGDFLEGLTFDSSLTFDEWVLVARQRLQRQVLEALHQLANYYTQQGEIAKALPFAWRQVELDPLGEPACRQLMRLLADSDQRSQALTQFERLRVVLAEELAIDPEAATLELCEQIRGNERSPARHSESRDNLPAFLTPLVGRRQELAEVQEQLWSPDCRLLTILGPGGSGKTRLALEIARSSRQRYTQGVFFVPLNQVQSPASILPAVVEALGLSGLEGHDHQTRLTNYLRDKHLLLVLDGFEHLLAGAGWLANVLRQAPELTILVTSCIRLNIKGEQLYPMSGMHYPQDTTSQDEILGADAVQLLLSGLRRAQPGYQPAPTDLGHLLQVCQQVQGMPLGILLAASWGATLTLEEIASEVSRSLDFLAADWADIPTRQRSLRATFDYTWNLLDEREQGIFRSLSVFRGTFTRAAAREVSSASPHELRALVDRSLLSSKSSGWYELHELLRQYGRERLAQLSWEEQLVCDRHSAYYLTQLARLGGELQSVRQAAAIAKIDLEHENYRAAWNWAAGKGAVAQLAQVLDALCLYYDLSHRFPDGESACCVALEGRNKFEASVEACLFRTRLLTWQSRFTRLQGRHEQACQQRTACQSLLEQASLSPADSRFEQALLSFEIGDSTGHSDLANARAHYLHSLELFQELGQPWWAVRARLGKGICDTQSGNFEAAQSGLKQCLADLTAQGDPRSLATALRQMGFLHARRGKMEAVKQIMQEAATIYRSISDRAAIADNLSTLGLMMGSCGSYQECVELLIQSLPIYRELGDQFQMAHRIMAIGMMSTFLGQYPAAKEWACRALSQARNFGFRRVAALSLLTLGWIALSEGDYRKAGEVLQESVEEYRQLKFLDELGWALAALGQAEQAQGETGDGLAKILESLQIGAQIGAATTISQALGPYALWIGRQGDPIRGIALYNLARQNPIMTNACWFEDVYGRPIAGLAERLPAEVVSAAQAHGRTLDLWQTAAVLLEELSRALRSPLPISSLK